MAIELPLLERVTCPMCVGTRTHQGYGCQLCGEQGTIAQFETREDMPCPKCGTHDAALQQRGPGYNARCRTCATFIYVVPKSELGLQRRKVKSRPDLKFGQRERILVQMGARCFLCGRDPQQHNVILHVAHALSVAENAKLEHPLSDEQLFDDANLFPACEECNLGMKAQSLEPAIMVRLILAKMQRRS